MWVWRALYLCTTVLCGDTILSQGFACQFTLCGEADFVTFMVQCSAVQCSAVQCIAVQSEAAHYETGALAQSVIYVTLPCVGHRAARVLSAFPFWPRGIPGKGCDVAGSLGCGVARSENGNHFFLCTPTDTPENHQPIIVAIISHVCPPPPLSNYHVHFPLGWAQHQWEEPPALEAQASRDHLDHPQGWSQGRQVGLEGKQGNQPARTPAFGPITEQQRNTAKACQHKNECQSKKHGPKR